MAQCPPLNTPLVATGMREAAITFLFLICLYLKYAFIKMPLF